MFENGLNYVTELSGVAHLKWKESFVKVSERDYSALAFRIKGKASISVGDAKYNANSNDILYLPQNTAYMAEYSDTEILVIHFKTIRDDTLPEVYRTDDPERIYGIFLKACFLWNRKEAGYQEEILSLLYGLFAKISKTKTANGLRQEYLNVISFMHSNFGDGSLSVPQICKETGISETSFRKFMKQYCNKTPIEYLTELRLEYARNMIACGATIKQAALESGFNDPKYFSRTVKKYYGCTARNLKAFGK